MTSANPYINATAVSPSFGVHLNFMLPEILVSFFIGLVVMKEPYMLRKSDTMF